MAGNTKINNISSEFRPSANKDGSFVADRRVVVGSGAAPLIVAALADSTTHVACDTQLSSVYYTIDGSDPADGSNGHFIAQGVDWIWNRELAEKVRVIRGDGTDANIQLSELQHI